MTCVEGIMSAQTQVDELSPGEEGFDGGERGWGFWLNAIGSLVAVAAIATGILLLV
ncbi:MAG: hypothetical protein K0S54_3151 [Alphaproteobacteria bacterium]|nr:hypothetical protein [Alphaproteobacteria bacterium]